VSCNVLVGHVRNCDGFAFVVDDNTVRPQEPFRKARLVLAPVSQLCPDETENVQDFIGPLCKQYTKGFNCGRE
jgi:hypothetical protein